MKKLKDNIVRRIYKIILTIGFHILSFFIFLTGGKPSLVRKKLVLGVAILSLAGMISSCSTPVSLPLAPNDNNNNKSMNKNTVNNKLMNINAVNTTSTNTNTTDNSTPTPNIQTIFSLQMMCYAPRFYFPVTNTPIPINSTLDIKPDTLNLKSKKNRITAYIELPADYNLNDIDINTVCINKIGDIDIEPVYADLTSTEIGDYNNDGISELMVKFIGLEVRNYINENTESLLITVEGKLNDETSFTGTDNIKVVQKKKKNK